MLKYYKGRLCLNVLANSIDNASEIYKAAKGYVAVGVLSANYITYDDAVEDMLKYCQAIDNNVSIGLGGGNPNQATMVANLAKVVPANHVNQVFTAVGETRAKAASHAHVNALVSPSGTPGHVIVSTGPLSSKAKDAAIVPIDTAILMIKDMGGNSVKFFPMKGLETLEEYREVAKACARNDFILEPTGGLDLENLETVIRIALDEGVHKVIPHVYSSIIDKETGATNIDDVKKIMAIFEKVMN